MIYVLAKTFRQAQLAADRLRLYKHCWQYIDEDMRLMGVASGSLVIELETAFDHPNYNDIKGVCRVRDLQVCSVSLDRLLGGRR